MPQGVINVWKQRWTIYTLEWVWHIDLSLCTQNARGMKEAELCCSGCHRKASDGWMNEWERMKTVTDEQLLIIILNRSNSLKIVSNQKMFTNSQDAMGRMV